MSRRYISAVLPLLVLVGLFLTPGTSQAQKSVLVPNVENPFPGKRALQAAPPPNRIIVRFKPGKTLVGRRLLTGKVANRSLTPMTFGREIPKLGLQVYRIGDPNQMSFALTRLRQMPEVLYAEPASRITLFAPPNDPFFLQYDSDPNHVLFPPDDNWPYQWPLSFVQAEDAWAIWPGTFYTALTKPTNAVRIAVIDTGIDITHPDFINAGGFSTDSLLGGQIDLTNSQSIIQGVFTNDPTDDFGHGTHVSGIAAAATNNGKGIASLGYSAQIMAMKVTEPAGDGDDADVIDAMIWATDRGALILNLSLGLNGGYSQGLQDAVNYAWSQNTVVIAAAGNDGVDYVRRYPAACNRVLAVAATTYASDGSGIFPNANAYTIPPYENRASYSNAGLYVGIAAPGGDASFFSGGELGLVPELYTQVWSTTPTYSCLLTDAGVTEFTYGYLNGTSMASPHVAALAALYAGFKGFTQATPDAPRKIIRAIQRGADNVAGRQDGGWTSVVGFGRINAYNTLLEQIGDFRPANTPGCIVGQTSYDGLAVQLASITATNLISGRRYNASSKEDGTYRLANLPPGNYSVQSRFLGRSQTLNPVVVEAGCDTMATDFEMLTRPIVTVTPHDVTVPAGAVQKFTAIVTGASSNACLWSVVSGPGTVDSAGNFTAGKTPNPAIAIVRATSLVDPTAYDEAEVTIPVYPSGLTLTPNPVLGGNSVSGKVTLSGIAAANTVVALSSNNPAASVPPSVTVTGGTSSALFTVTTMSVRGNTIPTISAVANGSTKKVLLTVQTLQTATVSVLPNAVTGGTSATGTVTLNGPAPAAGFPVTLTSTNPGVATVPPSVTVPAGVSSVNFTVNSVGGGNGTSTLMANAGGNTVRCTIKVNP